LAYLLASNDPPKLTGCWSSKRQQDHKITCALSTFERKSTWLLYQLSNSAQLLNPTSVPAVQLRRNKLVLRLWEQCELAKAQAAGTTFAPVKFRSVVENDTGIRRQVEMPKRVKPWWFTTESGKLALSVRYGTRVLELAKGKVAVEVGSEKDLVPTLELIKTAVLNGELDTQIDAAANKLTRWICSVNVPN
jgi:hypothetical protein